MSRLYKFNKWLGFGPLPIVKMRYRGAIYTMKNNGWVKVKEPGITVCVPFSQLKDEIQVALERKLEKN